MRDVTDAEVAQFETNGWAHLAGLISPRQAIDLRERAVAWMGSDRTASSPAGFVNAPTLDLRDRTLSSQDARFAAVARCQQLGANAARLLGRDSGIRLMVDSLGVKWPAGEDVQSSGTAWHQDNSRPVDRSCCTFWIALDEVTPDQGSLQFYSGSHALGSLGHGPVDSAGLQVDQWPRLSTLEVSKPHHLMPGDATVHHTFTVHGAPANHGTDPRWAYIVSLMPADSRYLCWPYTIFDDLELAPFEEFDRPRFPVIYQPAHT